jgi:hypothetical protein
MGMICDACGTKFGRDDGQSTLNVSPPRPDFKLFQALATTGQLYEHRDPLHLDLCLSCTSKVLSHLGLSTEICTLPEMPAAPSDGGGTIPAFSVMTPDDLERLGIDQRPYLARPEPAEPPLAGALTLDDLRELGIAPDNRDSSPK